MSRRGIEMSNVLTVAKKELSDLVNSKLVTVFLVFYLFIFFSSFYDVIRPYPDRPPILFQLMNDPIQIIFVNYAYLLCWYGSQMAIILGFISMTRELDGKALNTLLAKPLYRDTIINGKMLGAIAFSILLFVFTTALYILAILVYFSNSMDKVIGVYIPQFLGGIPLAFMLSMLTIMFFYSLTILFCVLFKDQSLALFACILAWLTLFLIINGSDVAGYIGAFFNSEALTRFISGFSIYTMLFYILEYMDIVSVVTRYGFEVLKLGLYCLVTTILAYIAFLRRDVA